MSVQTISRVTLSAVTLSSVLAISSSLPAAAPVRTADSAGTPSYADWHQKQNDQIMADLKKRDGDVGLLLVGDSITADWPKKGPKSYATFSQWKTLNVAISGELTEHVLYRLLNGNIEGIKPKAAMILVGTNNLGVQRIGRSTALLQAIRW